MQTFPPGMTELNLHKTPTPAAPDAAGVFFLCFFAEQLGADIPEEAEDEIRAEAIRIFNAIDGFGLARVDFFLEKDTNRVIFNEVNTLPGFTSISMYPMLWDAEGYDIKTLVNTLIEMAFER